MSKFVKYMSATHLNFLNIALKSCGTVTVENVTTDKVLASHKFENVKAAESWYQNMKGTQLGKLENAIDLLVEI